MGAKEEPTKGAELLRFHGHVGFSIGRYTELFMFPPHGIFSDEDHPDPVLHDGAVEGSVGQVSPLAHFLFDSDHNEDLSGEFSSFHSLRLVGVARERGVALSALLLLERKYGMSLATIKLGDFVWSTRRRRPRRARG